MVNFFNLFIICTTLNYGFLHNIRAANNNNDKKKTREILILKNIQDEKYEINGTISVLSTNFTQPNKRVKITEIKYDGIKIQFVDKDYSPINITESEFHRIMCGDLKSNDNDYYFKFISSAFKVTAFIEEKCFHTTLWYNCRSIPMKIYTSLHDQLPKSIRLLGPNLFYKYMILILPPNCFDNTACSNSKCSEKQNIYTVDVLKAEKREYGLYNLTIDKESETYNIDYFIFDYIFYSEVYTKIYCVTSDHGMIKGYIGKSTNQCNMNEKILASCTKTNKSQNENNLKNQRVQENTSTITKISCNTQINEIENPNPYLINKCQHCQKNIESKETQANLDDLNTKNINR